MSIYITTVVSDSVIKREIEPPQHASFQPNRTRALAVLATPELGGGFGIYIGAYGTAPRNGSLLALVDEQPSTADCFIHVKGGKVDPQLYAMQPRQAHRILQAIVGRPELVPEKKAAVRAAMQNLESIFFSVSGGMRFDRA